MTASQKKVIVRALNDTISGYIYCRDVRASEENWESVNFFNEIINELKDALWAFEGVEA